MPIKLLMLEAVAPQGGNEEIDKKLPTVLIGKSPAFLTTSDTERLSTDFTKKLRGAFVDSKTLIQR